jgi:hypothetical protein
VAVPSKIPGEQATWSQISKFALSFNGYEELGDECGDVANSTAAEWDATGALPSDIRVLRGCLFFEQRRTRMGMSFDFNPDAAWKGGQPGYEDWVTYIKALVEEIRVQSAGGVV